LHHPPAMIAKLLAATSIGTLCVLGGAFGIANSPAPAAAADPVESGRFVWHDLLTANMGAAKRFYGDLFGWHFEDSKRGNRPYVIARLPSGPVAGLIDVRGIADAGQQWLSYMAVVDIDKTVAVAQLDGARVLAPPRDLPLARAAVVADPQGAPLGLAQLRGNNPDLAQPTPGHFFWQEYLAKDAVKALEFYKRLAGYEPAISDSRLGIEYHLLKKASGGAGLFQLPATVVDVQPNWLPYVLVDNPEAIATRVIALGGRILLPAAPERRNRSLVVIADPGGAPLALQKYPF